MKDIFLLALLAAQIWPLEARAQAGDQTRDEAILSYDRRALAERETAGPVLDKAEPAPVHSPKRIAEAPAMTGPVLTRSLSITEDVAVGIGRFAIHAPPRRATNVEPLRADATSTLRDGNMAAVGMRMSF